MVPLIYPKKEEAYPRFKTYTLYDKDLDQDIVDCIHFFQPFYSFIPIDHLSEEKFDDAFICGGAIFDWWNAKFSGKKPSIKDIDVYFSSWIQFSRTLNFILMNGGRLVKVRNSDVVVEVHMPEMQGKVEGNEDCLFQLDLVSPHVCLGCAEPEEVLETFDILNCAMCVQYKSLTTEIHALDQTKDKRMYLNSQYYDKISYFRIEKYRSKGLEISDEKCISRCDFKYGRQKDGRHEYGIREHFMLLAKENIGCVKMFMLVWEEYKKRKNQKRWNIHSRKDFLNKKK